jgi:hypothetical protein
LNGADDLAVPAACVRRTTEVLTAACAAAGVPERFRFVMEEGAGHNVIARTSRDEMLAWFRRWFGTSGRR